MKKYVIVTLLMFVLSACSPEEVVEIEEKVYPVEVTEIKFSEKTEKVKYVGILQPEQMINKTFENVIEVEKIFVDEGDEIKKGDLLAKQNTDDLEDSKEQLSEEIKRYEAEEEAAYQQMLVKKYELQAAEDNQESNLETLKQEQDDAKKQMDADKLALDNAQVEYDQAESNYQESVTAYNTASDLVDATDPADSNYSSYVADRNSKQVDMETKETIRDEKQAALVSAQASYNSSRTSYELAETRYNNANEGNSLDTSVAEAEYRAAEANYQAAKSQTAIARSSFDSVDERINNSYLYSDIDGYVLTIVAKEGEVSNPLVPAMVIGSSETVATIGISQNNIRRIEQGMKAIVKVNDLKFDGEVLSIAKIPDRSSRTYETDIAFPESLFNFYIGETCVIEIIVGEKNGIWIPINIIQNDGIDYVYIVKDNRVVKRNITPSDIDNDFVRVEGLFEGDIIITNGMKQLKPGYLVDIVGDSNE